MSSTSSTLCQKTVLDSKYKHMYNIPTAADPGMFLLELPESIILRIQFNNGRIPTMMMTVMMRSEGDGGDYSI